MSGGVDTTMGGERSRFASTSLSRIIASPGEAAEALKAQLVRVTTTFWKPIYFYIRRMWSKSDADAKDLTQEFLVHLLEHDLIGRFDQARGNFRTYLKRCLQSFLGTEARDASRLKRGGGKNPVSLDIGEPPAVPQARLEPDQEFDRDWAAEALDRAIKDVEASLRAAGRGISFDVFRAIVLDPPPGAEPGAREVGEKLGLGEREVHSHLRYARQQLRDRLLKTASEYVVNEADVFAEMTDFLSR